MWRHIIAVLLTFCSVRDDNPRHVLFCILKKSVIYCITADLCGANYNVYEVKLTALWYTKWRIQTN